jgi:hypothetical protein
MAPRGLKALLRRSAPAKLMGPGKKRSFRALRGGAPTGVPLRGLTKWLAAEVWSAGALPRAAIATKGGRRVGWRGKDGGLRRGRAVDAQVTRAVNAGKTKPQRGQYSLTKLVLAALAEHGLEPVLCQRAVCNEALRVGTAADVLCYEPATRRLCVVELKCGCSGDKMAAAVGRGANAGALNMRAPVAAVRDCVLHRHILQLACTRDLLLRETDVVKRLIALGLDPFVSGALLYVDDDATEMHRLTDYWMLRAARILAARRPSAPSAPQT